MTTIPLPQHDRDAESVAGHWLLARVGKKVLRPGGRELSEWLVSATSVAGRRVVEFAPGLGLTATLLLDSGPASYTGVDSDPEAVEVTRDAIGGRGDLVVATAQETGLETGAADIVVGEAMLTMQGDAAKQQIVAEAGRVLEPGARTSPGRSASTPARSPWPSGPVCSTGQASRSSAPSSGPWRCCSPGGCWRTRGWSAWRGSSAISSGMPMRVVGSWRCGRPSRPTTVT